MAFKEAFVFATPWNNQPFDPLNVKYADLHADGAATLGIASAAAWARYDTLT